MSDAMLSGVLRMPYGLAMGSEIARRQYWDRGQQACDELDVMRARAEAAEKDAARYRWLRDPNNMRAREVFRYYGDVDATELDDAIDAAMAAT